MRVPWLCRDLRLQSPLAPDQIEGVLKARVLPFVDTPPSAANKAYMGSVSAARFLLYPLGKMLPDWRPQARGRVIADAGGSRLEVEVGLRPAAGVTVHLLFALLVVMTSFSTLAMLARGEVHAYGLVPLVAAIGFFAAARWRFCRDADSIERFLEDATLRGPQAG